MKVNKSYSKRLRVTKNGKLMARKPGKCHFKAKNKRSKQLEGKRSVPYVMDNKLRGRFLPNI